MTSSHKPLYTFIKGTPYIECTVCLALSKLFDLVSGRHKGKDRAVSYDEHRVLVGILKGFTKYSWCGSDNIQLFRDLEVPKVHRDTACSDCYDLWCTAKCKYADGSTKGVLSGPVKDTYLVIHHSTVFYDISNRIVQ